MYNTQNIEKVLTNQAHFGIIFSMAMKKTVVGLKRQERITVVGWKPLADCSDEYHFGAAG